MAESGALHVGIDGRELLGHPTGVGRWVSELLREWAADRDRPLRLSIFTPEAVPAGRRALAPEAAWIVVPSAQSGTWWEQLHLPAAVTRAKPDVFLAPGYTAPVRLKIPFLVAVHDVSYFAHPEWFSAREGWRRRLVTKAAARRAHAVLTISEFSASEIVRWLGVDRSRVRVVYPGAPVDVTTPASTLARADRVRIGEGATILYVGSLFERRHVGDLIAAMPLVARRVERARLVIVGESRAQPAIDPRALAVAQGVADRIDWRPYVDEAELNRLYDRAGVFAFLSDYEGFALTPMEAIAHGVPPVMLDTEVSREVYADGARFVQPTSTDIAQAIVDLLTRDGAHASLLERGRARLAAFSWARAAAQVRAALEEAAR